LIILFIEGQDTSDGGLLINDSDNEDDFGWLRMRLGGYSKKHCGEN
jgi:hypothetical protein